MIGKEHITCKYKHTKLVISREKIYIVAIPVTKTTTTHMQHGLGMGERHGQHQELLKLNQTFFKAIICISIIQTGKIYSE